MNVKATRWRQRFQNLERAFINLSDAVTVQNMSTLERAGLIQFFEFTFELTWKTMKDYLESEGYDVKSPRDTIKQAFQIHLIENGHAWLAMLDERNNLSHTYNEQKSKAAEHSIKADYYPLIKVLFNTLKAKQ